MVTREEIREGTDWILCHMKDRLLNGGLHALILSETRDELFSYLHSKGVVIRGKQDPKYIALFEVEPLIEESQ